MKVVSFALFAGENENRTVLDAFFLGKALAEALNERIESTVGEFLSTIGRLQAEQQKQVQDFQVLCCSSRIYDLAGFLLSSFSYMIISLC